MRRAIRNGVALALLMLAAGMAGAQALVGVDDSYGVPYAEPLVVEPPGVIDNDTYNGAPAADAGATVTLIDAPVYGTLECDSDPVPFDLCPDGSFSYTPGSTFAGFDSFTYEVALGDVTDQATVVLSACSGGPSRFVCWQEAAYLAQLAALGGYQTFQEGFEDDLAWGATRSPLTEPSVLSQGVTWQSNHPLPPASNELTTSSGPARTGLWGMYDPEHGYATGTSGECDVNNPPDSCLYKDGFTGTREPGETVLYAAGGFLIGAADPPNLVMILDGGAPIGLGRLAVGPHQFFGVIDTAGFTSFRVEETDGKVGQSRYVFGDDFTLATTAADTTPPRVVRVNSIVDTGDGVLAEAEATDASITELLVSFSELVRDVPGDTDPHDVTNPANYLVINDGGNGFQTVNCAGGVVGDDVEIAVDGVTYTSGSLLEADLMINGGLPLPVGSYRLLVCGTTSIRDWAGNPLDGNGDGTGGDDFARNFSIILPVNNPPIADPQAVTTPEDTARAITLTASDPDGDPLTYSIVTPPTHGALSGTPPSVTYTPTAGYFGPDSFSFRVWDGTAYSNTATVSITVTEVPLSVLTIGDASLIEGDVGSTSVNVTVTLTPASTIPVSVSYATGGGTATAGADYTAAAGTADFAIGATTAVVPLEVLGDLLDEPDEEFGVTLSTPVGATLGTPSTGTVTIFDDDPMSDLSGVDLVVDENGGQAIVALTLSAASGFDITVDYVTANGTATAPADYGAVSGTAFIAAGALSTTVPVTIVDDALIEGDELFTLELSNPGNAVLLTPSITVTIRDDDGAAIFDDGFESGDASAWSAVVP